MKTCLLCPLLAMALSIASSAPSVLAAANAMAPEPLSVPANVREQFKLAPFYQAYLDAGGMPVVGSAQLNPDALRECVWIVTNMLAGRPGILKTLGEANVRFAVMAWNEYTTDVPEHARLAPRVYWDRRARGLGASTEAPAVSCGEENLLSYPGDPYPTENIGIHEFAHAIHLMAMSRLDPQFDQRLKHAYNSAIATGLWTNTYAALNPAEYWAEAVQDWFDDNRENDSLHNHVNTRAELKEYDPAVATLCKEVFGDRPWRYLRPALRPPEGRAHLKSPAGRQLPRFEWRKEPIPEQARFQMDCPAGRIEVELAAANERAQVAEFLETIQLGYYGNGKLRREGETLILIPGASLPTGEPVSSGAKHWRLALAGKTSDGLAARILEGAERLPGSDGTAALQLQRITRLN